MYLTISQLLHALVSGVYQVITRLLQVDNSTHVDKAHNVLTCLFTDDDQVRRLQK